MIEINIKNSGKKVKIEKNGSIFDALKSVDRDAAKKAIAAEVFDARSPDGDRETVDLSYCPGSDLEIDIIYPEDIDRSIDILNHSSAHIMAAAIKKLFPDVKFAIGPSIKNGFYYDFETDALVSPQELPGIEKEMKKIINANSKFEKRQVSKKEAKKIFKDNPYKIELIDEIDADSFSIYSSEDFTDLCIGPHIPSTGKVRAFKLLSIAGAYWRGDEKNKMLVRIYGTSFYKKEDLRAYLDKIERAKRSDHRKIGKDLDLFSFHDEAPGFPFFHPNGVTLKNSIVDFWRDEHLKGDYKEVQTPVILCNELWKTSGHWDNYKENMYFVKIDEKDYAVKPMNCPGSIIIYKSNQHSYKELPLRYAELGLVHRHEKSGVLHGLFRVRNFTQDDAHIFCTEDQLKDEISNIIDLVDRMYKVFGFESYHMELSTRPEKSIGSDKMWEKAEKILKDIIKAKKVKFTINEGDGAFYGPKIDFHIKDCLDRTWQCATIQLDFAMPEKFNVEYVGEDNARHRPVMIHRVVLGSVERFMGIMLEHYSGNLPPWLAPVQLVVLPISEKFYDYANNIYNYFKQKGYRIEIDNRVESLNKKIRQAEIRKIPFMIVVGQNEEKTETVTIRRKKGDDIKEIQLEEFNTILEKVVSQKENRY